MGPAATPAAGASPVTPPQEVALEAPGPRLGIGPRDVAYRLRRPARLAKLRTDRLRHRFTSGRVQLALFHNPLFDPAWYLAQAPAAGEAAPLLHYLAEGAAAGLSPHPLFDPAWYQAAAPEAGEGLALLRHYLAVGAAQGLSPSPFFDPQHGPNTNVVLRARDAQKLAQAKRAVEDMLERVRRAQSNTA